MATSIGMTGKADEPFPLWRVLVAMLVVSALTPIMVAMPAIIGSKPSFLELLLLPLHGLLFGWLGDLTFLVFGLPTLFMLHRLHRKGFAIFALFGVLYTAFGAVILCLFSRSRPWTQTM